MSKSSEKQLKRDRRHGRIRSKIFGTAEKPRLSVYRSNRFIYAQLVDDANGVTLVAASDLAGDLGANKTKVARAHEVGETLAKLANAKNITHVVFDRGGFLYAGRIKALADGAREAGLSF